MSAGRCLCDVGARETCSQKDIGASNPDELQHETCSPACQPSTDSQTCRRLQEKGRHDVSQAVRGGDIAIPVVARLKDGEVDVQMVRKYKKKLAEAQQQQRR
jgi:hypothetical protein